MIECANEDCNVTFEPKAHNAIYCGAECRRIVSNKKVLEKYHEKKNAKSSVRVCRRKTCSTILSRYNDETICGPCREEEIVKDFTKRGFTEEEVRNRWYT